MGSKEWNALNREMVRLSSRTSYKKHAAKVKARVKARKKKIRDWFQEYKRTLVCSRCPENHPACLDFHHKDPTQKDLELPQTVNNGWSLKRIKEEIAKCEVLCANCHRKEHARQRSVTG